MLKTHWDELIEAFERFSGGIEQHLWIIQDKKYHGSPDRRTWTKISLASKDLLTLLKKMRDENES